MSKEVEIKALRPFNRTSQGDICEPGDVFRVDEARADELERLGLATRDIKPFPDNFITAQAAPKPLNKAAPSPKTKGITSKAVKLSGKG